MARNSEKAMAMLNRWYQMKHNVVAGTRSRRPRQTEEAATIRECERWRHQIIREVTQKIAEIQNAGLGEHRIRDLNDEINKLLKEKTRWEIRIRELGGPDYRAAPTRMVDVMGAELSTTTHSGYKYFGAAKDLPGVRELFEQETVQRGEKKNRAQLYRNITPDYYGWRDEEDPDILLAEKKREMELEHETLTNRELTSQQHTHPTTLVIDSID